MTRRRLDPESEVPGGVGRRDEEGGLVSHGRVPTVPDRLTEIVGNTVVSARVLPVVPVW